MKLTKRSTELFTSQTVGLSDLVMEAVQAEKEVLGLHEGELDFPTPEPIIRETIEALEQGRTRYSLLNGEGKLRELICRKLSQENAIAASPREILVTNGSKQAIYEIVNALIERGDEVIIPVPTWPTYVDVVRLAGGTPVLVDMKGDDLSPDAICGRITRKTKLIIVNSPNNPTGAVYSRAAMVALCKGLQDKRIYLLSDEAYEGITYDDARAISPASLSECNPAYTITTQTFSKRYAMTGYRVGYVHAHAKLIDKLSAIHSNITDNVCTFAQYGAIAALSMDRAVFAGWRECLARRRERAVALARELFSCPMPKGAFYIFPEVKSRLDDVISSSAQMAEVLLRDCNVACVPGEVFYRPGHLRFCYAVPESTIDEAFRRMARRLG